MQTTERWHIAKQSNIACCNMGGMKREKDKNFVLARGGEPSNVFNQLSKGWLMFVCGNLHMKLSCGWRIQRNVIVCCTYRCVHVSHDSWRFCFKLSGSSDDTYTGTVTNLTRQTSAQILPSYLIHRPTPKFVNETSLDWFYQTSFTTLPFPNTCT